MDNLITLTIVIAFLLAILIPLALPGNEDSRSDFLEENDTD